MPYVRKVINGEYLMMQVLQISLILVIQKLFKGQLEFIHSLHYYSKFATDTPYMVVYKRKDIPVENEEMKIENEDIKLPNHILKFVENDNK